MPPNVRAESDHIRAFRQAIFETIGATLPASELVPGEIIRFDDLEKSHGNKACWAVLHLDGCPNGAFGSWRTGETHTWKAESRPITREDREQTRRIIEAAKRKRERETEERHTATAEIAGDKWQRATPATVEHPYIAAKRVTALGVRVLHSELLVPLRTVQGDLVNLQRIYADGGKRFLSGGRITGCFCLMAKELPHQGEVYICEGWATAATIHAQTRLPVAAAMNAGNLLPVAQAIRAARPGVVIVIAADYDHRTPGHPGLRYARHAARGVDRAVPWPQLFANAGSTGTDFNAPPR